MVPMEGTQCVWGSLIPFEISVGDTLILFEVPMGCTQSGW